MDPREAAGTPTEDAVREALQQVNDPEVGMSIVDLGLVYRVDVIPGHILVEMTMTTPACPLGDLIMDNAREAIGAVAPVGTTIEVHLVWDPPWTPAMMSESARTHFGW